MLLQEKEKMEVWLGKERQIKQKVSNWFEKTSKDKIWKKQESRLVKISEENIGKETTWREEVIQ